MHHFSQNRKRIFIGLLMLGFFGFAQSQDLQVIETSCNGDFNPLGIEDQSPRLSWKIISTKRGIVQKGYWVQVAEDSISLVEGKHLIWDTKRVFSDVSIQLPYQGKKLFSGKTYYWRVKVWDQLNRVSNWSKISHWHMGLLQLSDWKGAIWIAHQSPDSLIRLFPFEPGKGTKKNDSVKVVLPIFRKEFSVDKKIKRALVYVSGLGQFEMSVNGRKVGNHFMDPGWSQYDKEVLYVTFDITSMLQKGMNAIGMMLGNGMYHLPATRYRKFTGSLGFPKMIMRLSLEYVDGSTRDIISDESWKSSAGPIVFSSVYGGEDYDAGLEQPGWDKPNFNETKWQHTIPVKGPDKLISQFIDPVRVMDTLEVKSVTSIVGTIQVYDLRQNASGIPLIEVEGNKGDTVRIISGELLKEDGTVSQKATGSPSYFQYILKGEGREVWQPRFSYYGYRYMQVNLIRNVRNENTSHALVLHAIKSLHVRSSAHQAGSFITSNTLFNKIDTLITWAEKSNMQTVLTDCPHRERIGWLEQAHLMGNSLRYTFDMSGMLQKTLQDMRAIQGADGYLPEYAPEYVKMYFMDSIFTESPEWGSTSVILPWYLYEWYGDKEVLKINYGMMKKYLSYLNVKSKEHILSFGLSDWYDLGPNRPGLAQLTPMGLTATAIYYYDLTIMQKVSATLENEKDRQFYLSQAENVKRAFNTKFFDVSTMQYGSGSQTANAMAIYMKLVPAENKAAVLENLIKDIRSRDYAITSGDIGFRYLLKVLEEEGMNDVIYKMNNRSDVPGYGYQIAKGATALTESWQALPIVSNNHLMLGHLQEWFYAGLAGLKQSSNSIAYKQIVLEPSIVEGIDEVKSFYHTPFGKLESSWQVMNTKLKLDVTVPVNSTAIVKIPLRFGKSLYESGNIAANAIGVKSIAQDENNYLVHIGSGTYHFVLSK